MEGHKINHNKDFLLCSAPTSATLPINISKWPLWSNLL